MGEEYTAEGEVEGEGEEEQVREEEGEDAHNVHAGERRKNAGAGAAGSSAAGAGARGASAGNGDVPAAPDGRLICVALGIEKRGASWTYTVEEVAEWLKLPQSQGSRMYAETARWLKFKKEEAARAEAVYSFLPQSTESPEMYIKDPQKLWNVCEKQGLHPLMAALNGERGYTQSQVGQNSRARATLEDGGGRGAKDERLDGKRCIRSCRERRRRGGHGRVETPHRLSSDIPSEWLTYCDPS